MPYTPTNFSTTAVINADTLFQNYDDEVQVLMSDVGNYLTEEMVKVYTETETIVTDGIKVNSVETIEDLATQDGVVFKTIIVKDLNRGGTFIWSATGTANGGTVFAGATGYWVRQYSGAVNVKWFGAKGDGITDDYNAFISAHNFLDSTANGGFIIATSPEVAWKINSRMSWNTNKVGLKIDGIVDCTAMTTGELFYIVQSEPDVNKRTALNIEHPIIGGTFIGPTKSVSGVRFVVIQDSTSAHVCSGVTFRDGASINWWNHVYLGDGAFFTVFENYDFTSTTGAGSGAIVSIPAGTNSGERNRFIGCRFGSADTYIEQSNGNASTFLNCCSFNYSPRMVYLAAGTLHFTDGHIENDKDTTEWFYISGNNTMLNIVNTSIVVANTKTTYSEFYVHGDVITGGLFINNIHYINSSIHSIPLVAGTGRVVANRISFNGTSPVIGYGCNNLAYGTFENLAALNEWALAGTTLPVISNDYAHTGANSLKFAGVAGQNNSATFSAPCIVGQQVAISFWHKVVGYGTGGNFYATIYYTDRGGNIIGTGSQILNTTANIDWTLVAPNLQIVAPNGTVSVKCSISFFGVTTGTPFGYIDDMIINII